MTVKAVYLPAPAIRNHSIEISGEEHHHLVVARAEPEEKIEVFNGRGQVWLCSVTTIGKRATLLRVESSRQVPSPAIELILAQAMIRSTAFELALEKAVEVGVTRIVPFVAARSNMTSPRIERWRRIVVEAAKQSKHFHIPVIEDPLPFREVLDLSAASKILFSERQGNSLRSSLNGTPVLYLIGPEGGWTDQELESAQSRGFRFVSLGQEILRSETAAIIGAALIRHELGDF
jgi:16S rRNA (uracil1498-N3)-methyltransferase